MNDQTLPANQAEVEVDLPEPNLRLRFEFSPQIGKLIGALAKARKVFKPVLKTSKNPFFKSNYADLAEVVEATKDGLSDNELAVVQPPCFRKTDGTAEIHTMLAHSSGQWIRSVLEMPVGKQDAQGVGSAITYGRRYAYSGMVSVASEADDDGNAASGKKERTKEEEEAYEKDFDQRTADQRTNEPEYLAPFQQKAVRDAMAATGKTDTDLKTYLDLAKVQDLAHVNKGEDFQHIIRWANGVKAALRPTLDVKKDGKPGFTWAALYASASDKGYTREQVKDHYTRKYGVSSGTELNAKQFAELSVTVSQWADISGQ